MADEPHCKGIFQIADEKHLKAPFRSLAVISLGPSVAYAPSIERYDRTNALQTLGGKDMGRGDSDLVLYLVCKTYRWVLT